MIGFGFYMRTASSETTLCAGAERDSAVKQSEVLSREVAQSREAGAALQQQLTTETLGRQTEADKALKVHLAMAPKQQH